VSIRAALVVINEMEAAGVIGRYAICGALAAYNYLEPASTEDVDVLISFGQATYSPASGLVTLTPIVKYLASRGFDRFEKEGIMVSGWPLQFLPVATALDEEALASAEFLEIAPEFGLSPVKIRVLRPEHLVAAALSVERPKDTVRISQFLTEKAVDPERLRDVVTRHKLVEKWRAFILRTGTITDIKI
jgi:hypothetical protein